MKNILRSLFSSDFSLGFLFLCVVGYILGDVCSFVEAKSLIHSFAMIMIGYCNILWVKSDGVFHFHVFIRTYKNRTKLLEYMLRRHFKIFNICISFKCKSGSDYKIITCEAPKRQWILLHNKVLPWNFQFPDTILWGSSWLFCSWIK